MLKPHKYAKEIKAWADGYEIEFLTDSGRWLKCANPMWHSNYTYRIKPTPLVINGIEVPEPLREPLKYEAAYFIPHIGKHEGYVKLNWYEDEEDRRNLANGVIHSCAENAIKHTQALLSFTKYDKEPNGRWRDL